MVKAITTDNFTHEFHKSTIMKRIYSGKTTITYIISYVTCTKYLIMIIKIYNID